MPPPRKKRKGRKKTLPLPRNWACWRWARCSSRWARTCWWTTALGVPESVIALTFVALGTSLPELVTAITSLAKGHGALSLGNVIGANVFNLVLVSGVSVALAPFTIPQNSTIAGMNASLVMDIPVMFAVMLLLTVPALLKGKLSRPQGIALLCIYAAFCVVQFTI